MEKQPILVVMAAGMGSRYGGLKQIDPVGRCGEAILDYSLYDAYEAGFRTAVIIIKEAIRQDFMDTVGKRLQNCPMEIRYAYQELFKLPEGYCVPESRVKPWGTGHAILCAKEAIGECPFAVINADDYYGKSAFKTVFSFLSEAKDGEKYDYCMVGYYLQNTVSDYGSVSRGVCTTDAQGNLATIVERKRIEKRSDGIAFTLDGETWEALLPDTLVSMNLFGFTPSFLAELEAGFPAFLTEAVPQDPAKAEYLLPVAASDLLKAGKARIRMLSSADKWYGVTYAEDKPLVVATIGEMTDRGAYPEGLWK